MGIYPEGVEITPDNSSSVLYTIASEGYLDALRIPLLRGRAFTDHDRDESQRVAIIDETMAEKFWPGQDPIGKRVTFETETFDEGAPRVWREVVGVTRELSALGQTASSSEQVGHRPDRLEPRKNKRRPKLIALMTKPRHAYRAELGTAA